MWRETINRNVVVVMVAGKRNVVVVVYSSTIHEAVLKKKLSLGSMWCRCICGWKKIYIYIKKRGGVEGGGNKK